MLEPKQKERTAKARPLFLVALLLMLGCQPSPHGPESSELPVPKPGVTAAAEEPPVSKRVQNFRRSLVPTQTEGFGGTRLARIGNRVYFLSGFGAGQGEGRLMSVLPETEPDRVQEVLANAESSYSSKLTNPWGIVSDGESLYISTGFQSTEGAVIRVSQVREDESGKLTGHYERIAKDAGQIVNPSFLLVAEIDGARHCYWSEYTASGNLGGRVRRARVDGQGSTETFLEQLAYPAGLATNGVDLLVCESDGGARGRVLKTALAAGPKTLKPESPGVTLISPGTEEPIVRPFDMTFDGAETFFFSEGGAIAGSGLATTRVGRVRLVRGGANTAQIVTQGLAPCRGLRAVELGQGFAGLVFATAEGLYRLTCDTQKLESGEAEQVLSLKGAEDVLVEDAAYPLFVGLGSAALAVARPQE